MERDRTPAERPRGIVRIDDRFDTVLRSPASGEAAARTQFRQLLDLIGALTPDRGDAPDAAYQHLDRLLHRLSTVEVAAILMEPGLRLRNARLVARLAEAGPAIATAAMAAAQLRDDQWEELIPALPITARGFLRHRRDLPAPARATLHRLGVHDLVLPRPEDMEPKQDPGAGTTRPPLPTPAQKIDALRRRIDAFRQARGERASPAPSRPRQPPAPAAPIDCFHFITDGNGTITWADRSAAPLVVGLTLGSDRAGELAVMEQQGAGSYRRRLPLRQIALSLAGNPALAGAWIVDAAPLFAGSGGAFTGYRGRMRRSVPAPVPPEEFVSEADRIRQLLHELRTPVNAIQGFAEVIQQQVFGPAPNEYRALAAGVAVDAARMMAGFDELERLARLESGALSLTKGETQLRRSIENTLRRLEGVLRPRGARMHFRAEDADFTVGLQSGDALQLVWRLLASLAGALAAGEEISLSLIRAADGLRLKAELPASMAGDNDPFAPSPLARGPAISAGAFGNGFALRLASAEAVAGGGWLRHTGEYLELALPVLTRRRAGHSVNQPDEEGISSV